MPPTSPAVPAGATGAPAELRRALGAFYTPPHAARHMVGMLHGVDARSRVLEPSGGDGAFVEALLESGTVAPGQIEVWDMDAAVGPILERFDINFRCRDSLLHDTLEGEGERRPTHVIGNPPYLNKQSDYVKANRNRLRRRYSAIGANDTYAMFIHMALEQLLPGGQLVFLVSDTFLTLGIHRKLREHLQANATIHSITLLPAHTFADASVNTAILNLTKETTAGNVTEIVDLRNEPPGEYHAGVRHLVPQDEFRHNVGAVFAFDPAHRQALALSAACPPLMSVLDGGLGMHTGDNAAFLGIVSRDDVTAVTVHPSMPVVPETAVDGTTWRAYHKRGGSARWWAPAEHCVRWDARSRGYYGIPASALAGEPAEGEDDQTPREGFIVSGVAASLTARQMTPGALWESNKAFGLFPKDPSTYPVSFFLAVLNSDWYNTVARALNHTVSFQARDLKALPLLPFTDAEIAELSRLGDQAVARTQAGENPTKETLANIERVVAAAAERAAKNTTVEAVTKVA